MKKGEKANKVVLDTTALIFLSDFSVFDETYTVQGVMDEVKDRNTAMKLSAILEKLNVISPNKNSVKYVKRVAEETRDIERLSDTDIDVLAVAKQLNCVIVSDDYNIQNVAGHMGIEYVSIFSPRIKKLLKWR